MTQVEKFTGQYGDTVIETIIDNKLYQLIIDPELTEEKIKEDFLFDYGKKAIDVYEMLIKEMLIKEMLIKEK